VSTDLRQLTDFDWRDRYSTSRNDLYLDFYAPAMARSANYDRAVGFFRSTVFSLAGSAVAQFALRGGHIRLVCSPEMSAEDAQAIENALELRNAVEKSMLRELERILESPTARPGLELLAALVATGHMDVRLCIWPVSRGLFHDKIGVFRDRRGNAISFIGSANETWQAWNTHGNHESFEVFESWTSEKPRVDAHLAYFESLWEGREPSLKTIEVPEAVRRALIRVNSESPEGIIGGLARAGRHRVVSRGGAHGARRAAGDVDTDPGG